LICIFTLSNFAGRSSKEKKKETPIKPTIYTLEDFREKRRKESKKIHDLYNDPDFGKRKYITEKIKNLEQEKAKINKNIEKIKKNLRFPEWSEEYSDFSDSDSSDSEFFSGLEVYSYSDSSSDFSDSDISSRSDYSELEMVSNAEEEPEKFFESISMDTVSKLSASYRAEHSVLNHKDICRYFAAEALEYLKRNKN